MEPLTEPEHRKQAIMHSGQVTHKIEQAIFTRTDLPLQVLVGKRREVLVKPTDDQLPRVERCETE